MKDYTCSACFGVGKYYCLNTEAVVVCDECNGNGVTQNKDSKSQPCGTCVNFKPVLKTTQLGECEIGGEVCSWWTGCIAHKPKILDDCLVICPHCENAYQPEAADFDEKEREEECEKCGGRYMLYEEFKVTHHTRKIL